MAVKLPIGFEAASGTAGVKKSGKPDLALLVSPAPLVWALTTTTNRLKAACVSRNRALFEAGGAVHGVVVNSGNANCATGAEGERDNEGLAEAAAKGFSFSKDAMLTASTGIVGHTLPLSKLTTALPDLVNKRDEDVTGFAGAILTTDLSTKTAETVLSGGSRIVGVAKGSGMIHPNMATMLAFVMTDANVSQERLRALWPEVVARSFNQVTVDGDTSPNDMALMFSSAQVEADEGELIRALEEVCQSLAKQIARDGEGATKLLTVTVRSARSDEEARAAARAVARSPLVKAAAHGNDPNWGRVLIAAGASGAVFEPAEVSIRLQDVTVYHGAPQAFDAAALSKKLDAEEVRVELELGAGEGEGVAWGCDLSREYVTINADYHT